MNVELLYNTVTGLGLNTGDVQIIYDFTKIYSGGLIFNERYSTGVQFDFDTKRIFPETNLGIIQQSNGPISGNEDLDDFDFYASRAIRILGMTGFQNWTSFFKIKFNSCNIDPANKNRILFFNKNNLDSSTGIVLSLDDGNKFAMEYDSKFLTSTIESNKESIFSLERNDTFLNFELYYPNFYDVKKSYIQKISPYNVNNWYIGGFDNYNDIYTGLGPSGKIELDFFVLFNKSLDSQEKLKISQSLLASGIVKTTGYFYYDEVYVSGDNIVTGGNISSGITGQAFIQVGEITGLGSEKFYIYETSGITGFITGEIILSNPILTTGTFTGTTLIDTLIPKYDTDNFYENTILITQSNQFRNLDDKDIYEVYALDNTGEGYPYSIYYNGLYNRYTVLNQVPDKYIYLYINGVLQKSGVLADNHFNISGDQISSNFVGFSDLGSYRYYTGFTGFATGITSIDSYSSDIIFSNGDYILSDIYLNGQKLISGLNYNQNSTTLTIYKDSLSNGELSFYPKIQYRDYITGNINIIKTNSGIAEEFIWFNGIKLEKDLDYRKVSCIGLLNNTTYNSSFSEGIWNTDSNGFFEIN